MALFEVQGKKESIIEEVGKKNIAKLINCKRIKKSSFIKNQEASDYQVTLD